MTRMLTGMAAWFMAAGMAVADGPVGYVITSGPGPNGAFQFRAEPYVPKSGDMVFFDDHKEKWEFLYRMVGSAAPFHAGLVFQKTPDQCAMLEAGPDDTLWCRVLELSPRFHQFNGTIHIRRVRQSLPADKRAVQTEWALAQDGKRYAFWRLLLQGTPCRCRSPLAKDWFGGTYPHRDRFLCAELVVAGNTVTGLFDPKVHWGNSVYPRDILYDDVFNLSGNWHEAALWVPRLPGKR